MAFLIFFYGLIVRMQIYTFEIYALAVTEYDNLDVKIFSRLMSLFRLGKIWIVSSLSFHH